MMRINYELMEDISDKPHQEQTDDFVLVANRRKPGQLSTREQAACNNQFIMKPFGRA